jgi:hypothetical protein
VNPSWFENSTATTISAGGLLTAGEVNSDTIVTVSASHTIDGTTLNATQDVRVLDTLALVSLTLSGLNSVNENSTAQYTATAFFSDGSSQSVNPTWSENSPATTISIFGLLSAGEVTNNTPVTVAASYTFGAITRTAETNVTVINTFDAPTYTLSVVASNGAVSRNPDQANYFSNSIVILTAIPTNGYQFSHWSGDAAGTQNPLLVLMTTNKNITANFIVARLPKQLTGVNLSNNVCRFVLNGPVGSNYVLQFSSDLITWLSFSTNVIPGGGAVIISDTNLSTDRRFYRAIPFTNASPGPLLINGSFEFPGLPVNGFINLFPGDTNLFGWAVGGTGMRIVWGNSGASAGEGTNDLTFNAGDTAPGMWIAQTFNTTIGTAYEVTFRVASTGNGAGSVTLRASARSQTGDVLAQVSAIPPPHDTGYGPVQQLVFTATSATTKLEFLDTSSATAAIDILLDDVAVHVVGP